MLFSCLKGRKHLYLALHLVATVLLRQEMVILSLNTLQRL